MLSAAPTREDLIKLQAPFPAEDVEFRLQTAGEKNGKFWGLALAYITNRAIMERLDEVCGPENWKNEFKEGPDGGILAGISIRVYRDLSNYEWVTKWDGASNTDVEAVKGGISNAMKRAGYQWGIGRYLYNLPESFVTIAEDNDRDAKRGQTKDKKPFRWYPPELPKWALPRDHTAKLQFIASLMEQLTDDTAGVVDGEPVKLKKFIVKHGDRLKESYKLASQVVVAVERATKSLYQLPE